MKEKARKPKILLWDIEASNLKANFGFMFCIGYMFVGEKKPTVLSLRDYRGYKKDPTNDKELLKDFQQIYNSADVVVAHYGKRFDLRFINTRAIEHKLPFVAPMPFIDTWRIAKDNLALNSNRLDTIDRMLPGNDEGPHKTPINNKAWVRAQSGHIPSLKLIEHHCYMDILVLKNVYETIKPLMVSHPNLAKFFDPTREGCPHCGSFNVQSRGTILSVRGSKKRGQCLDCRSWFSYPITKKVKHEK